MDKLVDLEDQLISCMDKETHNQFEQFCNAQTDVSILMGEERYKDGFKSAMQFAVETFISKDQKE